MNKKLLSLFLAVVMVLSTLFVLASCGDKECKEHVDANSDGKCDNCGADMPNNDGGGNEGGGGSGGGDGGGDIVRNWWEDVDFEDGRLSVQINTSSNQGELTSRSLRYLAGQGIPSTPTQVDRLVAVRNQEMATNLGLSVTYSTQEYLWGQAEGAISTLIKSGDSSVADIFVDYIYDMTCASLKDNFANIISTAESRTPNYFFAEQGEDSSYLTYFTEEGYMEEFMKSMSLSIKKMYLVGSDYLTDLVRAMFVVPVNVNLIESVTTNNAGLAELFEVIENGDWTYTKMAEYAAAAYQDTDGIPGETIGDTLGFAIGSSSGLSASGILYTTSVVIIEREVNDDGSYTVWYEDENQDLYNFFNVLDVFMDANGTAAFKNTDTTTAGSTALDAIRNQFAIDKILFGGYIDIGALEDEIFQNMENSFGVAPAPVYRAGDTYLTTIHNIGRVAGIRVNTQRFPQATAFLHYQSTHSSDILDEYYYYDLLYAAGKDSKSQEMIVYIRDNIRSSFDKIYEDAIANYFSSQDTEAASKKWHEILNQYNFQAGDHIQTLYRDYVNAKKERLTQLKTQFDTFTE